MNNTTHTPGPWKVVSGWNDNEVMITGPNGDERICTMDGNENNEANGNLIAAAPAMYETLKELLDSPNAKQNAMWDRARQAVAQAEGRG